jgi:lipopolysaccharide transport system permease protein
MLGMLRSLWQYRQFIKSSILNEIRCRFARSKLGGIWIILNPLAQVGIYALILSDVLASRLPGVQDRYAYSIYLMSGLLAWNLFNEIVMRSLHLFVQQANLLKKLNFPRIALPAVTVGTCLLDNLFLLIAILAISVMLAFPLSLAVLWVLPLTLLVVAFAVGIGLILGIVNVFIRDTGQVVPIVLQVWFWLTPIVYPAAIVPEQYRGLLTLNPMVPVISAYQGAFVYGTSPQFEHLLIFAAAAMLVVLFGFLLFRRASAELVDVL